MSPSVLAAALLTAAPLAPLPLLAGLASAEGSGLLPDSSDLAAQALASGRSGAALAQLERASLADPRDPAVLINLGIAYARVGEDAKAKLAFEAALACDAVIELRTADGTETDSRRLARKAIRMLERGAFRRAEPGSDHPKSRL